MEDLAGLFIERARLLYPTINSGGINVGYLQFVYLTKLEVLIRYEYKQCSAFGKVSFIGHNFILYI